MGYQDRRYNSGSGGDFGEGGGFRRALRRIFVEGDNFYGWSFPLFTVPRWVPGLRGIEVRIHLLFVIFIIGQLIWRVSPGSAGLYYAIFQLSTLWLLVLLHEFGHCLACRLVGGEADRVLLWPLGGLAMARPPHRWKASLITTLGGPGVNFVLIPILGGVMLALGADWSTIVFNPFNPGFVLSSDPWLNIDAAYWKVLLWYAYFMNFLLFAFNMSLVMYPMDAGRVVQELLWSRLGYRRSMLIATNLGMAVAVIIGAFAMLAQPPQMILFSIALFGGITCFNQRRIVAVMEDEPAWAYDTDKGVAGFGDDPQTAAQQKAYKAALKRQQKEEETQREVDRILDKIREKGMQSLSGREKAILKDATERGKGRS